MKPFLTRLRDKLQHTDDLRWLFHLFSPYLPQLLALTFLRCGITAVGIGSTLVNKQLVDWASALLSVKGTILLTIGCSLVSLLGNVLLSYLSVIFTQRCVIDIRANLYGHLMDGVWLERVNLHSQDHLSRLTGDVERICDGIISSATGLVALVLQFCLAFALLHAFDSTVANFALLSIPLIAFLSMGLGIYLRQLQLQVQNADAEYRVFLQEQLTQSDVVKAFEQEQASKETLLVLLRKKQKLVLKANRCSIGMRMGVSGAFTTAYLFALITGALKIASGSITYGTMTAFLSLVNQVQAPVLSLSNILSQLIGVWASATRVRKISDMQTEPHTLGQLHPDQSIGISGANIFFSYQPGKPVLQNLSFEIAPGTIAAIMGQSGTGKTTLIRLLLGFLPAHAGTLCFSSGNTQYPCTPDTRQLISYVPQGNTLFRGTVAENLRVGCPGASEDDMFWALSMACAQGFVSALPEGLETQIGEKGHGLSEGQAQRIAIARAFLRPSPILILDEATSALDADTEYEILKNVKENCSHRTCVIVSHRTSVYDFADQVIEL